jgi:hypothetical protein
MSERDLLASERAWMHQVCQRVQLVVSRCARWSQRASAGVADTARGAARHDPGAQGYLSLPQRASAASPRSEFSGSQAIAVGGESLRSRRVALWPCSDTILRGRDSMPFVSKWGHPCLQSWTIGSHPIA